MTPGGDSLGGDIFYTVTSAFSCPVPVIPGARLFAFTNAGTLAGWSPSLNLSSLLKTTRISWGVGMSVGTPLGRVEGTYSIPIRFGPMDARRSVQLGVGLNFS
jgi:outer membrane protein assembly factor BamA